MKGLPKDKARRRGQEGRPLPARLLGAESREVVSSGRSGVADGGRCTELIWAMQAGAWAAACGEGTGVREAATCLPKR